MQIVSICMECQILFFEKKKKKKKKKKKRIKKNKKMTNFSSAELA